MNNFLISDKVKETSLKRYREISKTKTNEVKEKKN